jgi:hypothetical protein
MLEVSQEVKQQHFVIIKKHAPNLDDATINAIVEETTALINDRLSKLVVLPR